MNDPLLDLPGYALRRAAGAMMAEFSRRLEPLGLRYADVSALLLIGANPTLTASQLGRMLDIQRANMVPLLNRLEGAGLIRREPIDRKSQAIVQSEAGLARLAQVREITARFEQDLLEKIPALHRPHFVPALQALLD